jgi:hypothetical protein
MWIPAMAMHEIMKEPECLIWDERLVEEDKELLADLNGSLGRLNVLRAVEIAVSGPFARSKIAWNLATYQHVLLHRIVALMDGAAVAWNNRCTLSAILSARALMETIAVMADFDERVAYLLARENLSQLAELVQKGIFASRDQEWLRQFPETKATNVLTYIDRFNEQAPGFRGHYDALQSGAILIRLVIILCFQHLIAPMVRSAFGSSARIATMDR